ncbi:hypothetical protein ACFVID_35140, partial [Streptomyces sp. NPDC127132]|uniref:hypothetical protein n=1 Tax=Streptomyces sp. NPDC127132 TaxID=3345374 RepID=UPI00363632F9
MYVQLRDTAQELAGILWREHTVYRERGGGVVIRGEHVRRWISLAPTGGKDRALLRAGRILDGGTTAPARSEVVVDLTAGTAELATICRRLLADVAAGADTSPGPSRAGRPKEKAGKREKPGRGRGVCNKCQPTRTDRDTREGWGRGIVGG